MQVCCGTCWDYQQKLVGVQATSTRNRGGLVCADLWIYDNQVRHHQFLSDQLLRNDVQNLAHLAPFWHLTFFRFGFIALTNLLLNVKSSASILNLPLGEASNVTGLNISMRQHFIIWPVASKNNSLVEAYLITWTLMSLFRESFKDTGLRNSCPLWVIRTTCPT